MQVGGRGLGRAPGGGSRSFSWKNGHLSWIFLILDKEYLSNGRAWANNGDFPGGARTPSQLARGCVCGGSPSSPID